MEESEQEGSGSSDKSEGSADSGSEDDAAEESEDSEWEIELICEN